jgi:hypothetical protein
MRRLPEVTLRKGSLPTFYRRESYDFYIREVDYKRIDGNNPASATRSGIYKAFIS